MKKILSTLTLASTLALTGCASGTLCSGGQCTNYDQYRLLKDFQQEETHIFVKAKEMNNYEIINTLIELHRNNGIRVDVILDKSQLKKYTTTMMVAYNLNVYLDDVDSKDEMIVLGYGDATITGYHVYDNYFTDKTKIYIDYSPKTAANNYNYLILERNKLEQLNVFLSNKKGERRCLT